MDIDKTKILLQHITLMEANLQIWEEQQGFPANSLVLGLMTLKYFKQTGNNLTPTTLTGTYDCSLMDAEDKITLVAFLKQLFIKEKNRLTALQEQLS